MQTPKLTQAQLVTIVGAALAVAISFAVPISEEQRYAILALVAALGSVLLKADKDLRQTRAENADKIVQAQKATAGDQGPPNA